MEKKVKLLEYYKKKKQTKKHYRIQVGLGDEKLYNAVFAHIYRKIVMSIPCASSVKVLLQGLPMMAKPLVEKGQVYSTQVRDF